MDPKGESQDGCDASFNISAEMNDLNIQTVHSEAKKRAAHSWVLEVKSIHLFALSLCAVCKFWWLETPTKSRLHMQESFCKVSVCSHGLQKISSLFHVYRTSNRRISKVRHFRQTETFCCSLLSNRAGAEYIVLLFCRILNQAREAKVLLDDFTTVFIGFLTFQSLFSSLLLLLAVAALHAVAQ